MPSNANLENTKRRGNKGGRGEENGDKKFFYFGFLCNRTYEWQYTYSHTLINTLLAMGIRIGLTTSCRHIIRTYA